MIDLARLAGHERIALSFSGGKDSLACVYLLRDQLDRITLYHLDTGDLLPEMRDIVEHVKGFAPHFVHIQSDVDTWIEANGLPTDLLPYSGHSIGRAVGEAGAALVTRYDCCYANLMLPVHERIGADGNTLVIRGTKLADMPALAVPDGGLVGDATLWLPLLEWSHADVMAYLRSVGAPICRVYEHAVNAPECARCPAWWSERRASYLRAYHPALFDGYRSRLAVVVREISRPLSLLAREAADCGLV